MSSTGIDQQRRLVRLWFGEHVIVNKTGDEAFANRLAEAMQRRFSSLTVTNDPLPGQATRAEQSSGLAGAVMTEPTDFRCPGAYDARHPLVLGYLRASLFGSHQELVEAREQMAMVAQMEGYTLASVFTEQAVTAPAAFSALVEAVKNHEAKGIVVPSAEHLAVLGTPPSLSEYLQRVTGVPLIAVQAPGTGRPSRTATPTSRPPRPAPPSTGATATPEPQPPWLIPP